MSNATIPSALYKYLAPNLDRASQILGDLRIRFSQVSVLNDVDEFQPPYKGVTSSKRPGGREFNRPLALLQLVNLEHILDAHSEYARDSHSKR